MGDVVFDLNMNLINNLLNVEFVHLKFGNNLLENDDVQLTLKNFKFNNGNHISRHQFVGASSISMTTCLFFFSIPKYYWSNQTISNILNQPNSIKKKMVRQI